jgi:signal transduction histidine kinase
MLDKLHEIIEAVSNSYGDSYFEKITLSLHKIIAADYIFIAKYNLEKHSNQTIVLVDKGSIAENFEYSLAGTPCADVLDGSVCFYPKEACTLFPQDSALVDMNIQGYLGVPLLNSKKEIIGLIAALFEQSIKEKEDIIHLFELFSGRIAAELERLEYENSLEDKIALRNQELSNTIEELKSNQKQLIESEKMSALGNLVAGVTHEVNTPLGIAITTHSIMVDELKFLNDKISREQLTLTDMNHYRHVTEDALSMQGENLIRAKKLIENFKKTAVDLHHLEIDKINIDDYYQQTISTLRSILKPKKAHITIHCPQNIVLATYPGVHAQILTNLINNSIRHGFSEATANNKITIDIVQNDEGEVTVHYCDNGSGLTSEAKKRVFEPFFTTARNNGGIGLGMSIIYKLITEKLNGNITIENPAQGACFKYTFRESFSKTR